MIRIRRDILIPAVSLLKPFTCLWILTCRYRREWYWSGLAAFDGEEIKRNERARDPLDWGGRSTTTLRRRLGLRGRTFGLCGSRYRFALVRAGSIIRWKCFACAGNSRGRRRTCRSFSSPSSPSCRWGNRLGEVICTLRSFTLNASFGMSIEVRVYAKPSAAGIADES